MGTPSAKQRAIEAVNRLPEDASLEDAMECLYVLEATERGLADVAAGRIISHDAARRRLGLR